jgi:DHA1 family bicyclomycin/chloramphenicol resistance-like MFS transporter
MGLFFVGSVFSLLAPSMALLLGARLIQGLGAGVAVVVSFAAVRDLFDEKKSAEVLSYMGMAIALSPGLAPVLGGYLTHHHGWQMCFGVVSVASFVLLLLLFLWMPETLREENRTAFSLKVMGQGYKGVFQNPRFLKMASIPSLMIGGLWGVLSGIPVLFTGYLNVSVQDYGYYGFSGVALYVLGTLVNSKLVHRVCLRTLLLVGLSLCMTSALLLGVFSYGSLTSPLIIQGLIFPFSFGLAFILPNGTALALGEVQEGVGTSAAFLGSLEMALGAVGVFLVGAFFEGTALPIAGLMFGSSLLSFLLYALLRKKDNKQGCEDSVIV